jgi:hypothetical protein
MLDPDSKEPLVTVAGLTALTTAGLGLAVAFGLRLSPDVRAGVLGVVAFLAPLAVAALVRHRVYSQATVARLLAAARARKTMT